MPFRIDLHRYVVRPRVWLPGALFMLAMGVFLALSNAGPTQAAAMLAPCPAWSIQSSPIDGDGANVLYGISALSSSDVWAVGYSTADGTKHTLAMRWDGKQWSLVPTPTSVGADNTLTAVKAESDSDVWVVGRSGSLDAPTPIILHWNGQNWAAATLPDLPGFGSTLEAISASSPTDVWAVGSYVCKGCTQRSLALHYDGTSWKEIDVATSGYFDAFFGVSAVTPDDAWLVGYRVGSYRSEFLLMHWDGKGLAEVVLPSNDHQQDNAFYSVLGLNSTDVWAVGLSTNDDRLINNLAIWKYDHGNWARQEIAKPSEEGAELYSITGNSPNDLWAAGYYLTGKKPRPLIMHYDGTSWSQAQLPYAGDDSVLNSISSAPDNTLFAAGQTTAAGLSGTLTERYADTCTQQATATPVPIPTVPVPTATTVPTVEVPGANSRTFPETGQTVSGVFLDYWDNNGGLAQQGYPISGEVGEVSDLNGQAYTVQYFERAVFEYHPENQAPYNVLLSQLGTFRYKQKYPDGAPGQVPNTSDGSVQFAETGKRLGGKFLAYWQANGGVAQQGYPISDEFQEKSDLDGKTYTVQYFERAVMELHPENQAPYDVLLSQLGTFRYQAKYLPSAPQVPQPSPTAEATSAPAPTATVTAIPASSCDGIPAGDASVIFQPSNCVHAGVSLHATFDPISYRTVVIIRAADGSVIGIPATINAAGRSQAFVDIDTTAEGFVPGVYSLTLEDQYAQIPQVGYFKLLP